MSMHKIPIVPTIIVVAAAALCVWFGFWQIGRAIERDARIEAIKERVELPALTLNEVQPELIEEVYYRRLSGNCARVIGWDVSSGRSESNGPGWRYVARCATSDGQPGFSVDMGVSRQPDLTPDWTGGPVVGFGRSLADNRTVFQRLFHEKPPAGLLIVAETPAPDLYNSKQPDPEEETNTSWSYAGQWFFFALTALLIYWLAIRRRWRDEGQAAGAVSQE